jgi:hypothetical protein
MALLVKETPILKGKDARIFSEKYLENPPKSVSKEEMDRMKGNFRRFRIKGCFIRRLNIENILDSISVFEYCIPCAN